ncbi:Ectonucleoside triphosphate diphosphohydrolase 5 [Nymphon striatum]|nr:Ectonucleoside triphosphate diphosphohydrolase 5 [Nymphon striatum]
METARKRPVHTEQSKKDEAKEKENLLKIIDNKSAKNPSCSMLKNCVTVKCILSVFTITAILAVYYRTNVMDFVPFFHKCDLPLKYSIIFDAGSTGSRIHIFSFYNDSGNFLLEKEIFEEVTPGLSSYAKNPIEAARSLIPLMEIAEKNVPKELQSSTSLALYATAGLRLLKETKADDILQEIKTLLKKYKFQVSHNAVSIMSGKNEAVMGWIAMNYLLDRLQDMKDTVALMDLGGGSTQITFLASDPNTLNAHPHDLKTLNLYGHNVTIYAKSYLGRGLMEARLNILGGKEDDIKHVSEATPELFLKSPCIADNYSTKWKYRGVNYVVIGQENAFNRNFESCFILIQPLTYVIFKPKELQTMELFAISYFNDRAHDSGLIDIETGGRMQVVQFYNKAKHFCDKKNDEHPLLCLDLSYITALLWKGYGIDGLREINLFKKIRDVETSWCLGAAIIQLMDDK